MMKETKTEPVLQYIGKQRRNCRDHVNRIVRTPQQFLQYTPRDRRSAGHKAKGYLESVNRPHGLTHVWKMMMTMKVTLNCLHATHSLYFSYPTAFSPREKIL